MLSQQLFRYQRDYESSLNIEELLELDASAPVGVRHLVPEVHLEGVDGVASQHRHDLPVVVEVTTIHDRAIVGDLDGDVAIGSPGEGHSFLVGLDRLDNAQFEVLNKHREAGLETRSKIAGLSDTYIAVWNDKGSAGLQDALNDIHTDDDGVRRVEARIRYHLNKSKG